MATRLHTPGTMKKALALGLGAALLAWADVRPAQACGGFFCNQPPPDGTLPIAQAAENVLFVMDRDPETGARTVEAHIQILYTGPASEFSWIVPVTAVPTVDVGADILFDRIEPPTRPSFRVNYQMDGTCRGFDRGGGFSCGGANSATGGFAPQAAGDGGAGVPPAVEVISRGSTGPYEYVVIRSEDGATLRTWLTTNGYFVSPDGAALIDEYVAGRFSFVAIRLMVGQDTSAIRPIVLRLNANEACLPLKLTAIAATPDLRINVWVLAEARAVPINYSEIAINQTKLDWFNFGRNYDQLLKDAANEAEGNAFAVEYAMPAANSVPWFTLTASARSDLAVATTPPAFMFALRSVGLQPTGAVLQLLRKHIPLPATLAARGVTEAAFYANIGSFWSTDMAAFAPFDAVAAADEFETEILVPMNSYRRLFERDGRLTRLATFISPEEMTADPLFVTNPSLPDVAPQHIAVAHVMCGDEEYDACDAPVRLRTEDGRDTRYRAVGCMQYERAAAIDRLPAAELAWQRDSDGAGQVVVDNRAQIMSALRAHNATIDVPGSGCGCLVARSQGAVVLLVLAAAVAALSLRRRRR
jgi:hypothetical protein